MMKKIILLLCLILTSFPALAQKLPCIKVTAVGNPAIAYTQRDNRCEGFYQSPVAAESLTLVGLLYGRLRGNTDNNQQLYVTVPQTIKQEVHIQATGIPLRTYYRLDAWVQPGQRFTWPLDIISKMQLRLDNIGLFGIPVTDSEYYTPLIIGDSSPPLPPLTLILRSSADAGVIHWRVSLMDKKGQCGQPDSGWKKKEPDWGDRFVSGKGIILDLPGQQENFCIEFATQTAGSADWLKLHLKILLKED
jgi:hypothetical protein